MFLPPPPPPPPPNPSSLEGSAIGIKNPAKAGEVKTNLERRVTNMSGSGGTLGARPQAVMGAYMPGMLNN